MALLALSAVPLTHASGTTFTVNSTLDTADAMPGDGTCDDGSGNCTLRAAIEEANALNGADTVNFNIAGGGVQTITLSAGLPTVTDPVIIDGTTQPGSSCGDLWSGVAPVWNLVVDINDQDNAIGGGLRITAGDSTVKGLKIGNVLDTNTVAGAITLDMAGNNTIQCVYAHDSGSGIEIDAGDDNLIGGLNPGEGNLLSMNDHEGVATAGDRTVIQGNFMGSDPSGMIAGANANRSDAIYTAGGSNAITNNLLAGCAENAIELRGTGGNVIQGNQIGTNRLGADLAGGNDCNAGIGFNGDNDNTVGGLGAGESNRIGKFVVAGLFFIGADDNDVRGNVIGVAADGITPLSSSYGALLLAGSANNTLRDNVIANATAQYVPPLGVTSSGAGVALCDPLGGTVAGAGNAILDNAIYGNDGRGIQLAVTAGETIDLGDGDTGPNNLQNFPVLSLATTTGSTTTVLGTLNSLASTTYRLEFFANAIADLSNHGEGQTYLGSTSVTTDSSGNTSFTASSLAPTTVGYVISATASQDLGGGHFSTSEFSANVSATAPRSALPPGRSGGGVAAPGWHIQIGPPPASISPSTLDPSSAPTSPSITPGRDLDAERAAIATFTRLFPRLPRTGADWLAVHHLAYGHRIARNLDAERTGLIGFTQRFHRRPSTDGDWRIVHVLGFSWYDPSNPDIDLPGRY